MGPNAAVVKLLFPLLLLVRSSRLHPSGGNKKTPREWENDGNSATS